MAINLICYTCLNTKSTNDCLASIKSTSELNFEKDFIIYNPRPVPDYFAEITREHSELTYNNFFIVNLNNKEILSRKVMSTLVSDLKNGFSDLLVLWENEMKL